MDNYHIQKIADYGYDRLSIQKVMKSKDTETLLISLENGHLFPEHSTPKPTLLIVLEGRIAFHIQNEQIVLHAMEIFNIPQDVPHHVLGLSNAKFLIIR